MLSFYVSITMKTPIGNEDTSEKASIETTILAELCIPERVGALVLASSKAPEVKNTGVWSCQLARGQAFYSLIWPGNGAELRGGRRGRWAGSPLAWEALLPVP